MAAGYGGGIPLPCNHKWGLWWAESSRKALELYVDLVSGVEATSRRVGGGRASAVGSG